MGWTDLTGKAAAITVGCVVAIAASIAGDTSQDLKTGYLLGATPRRQQVGELVGVLTSAVFVCLAVLLLAETFGFGSTELPAPQATLMKLVIDGVLDQSLPWGLVALGVGIAVGCELLKIPSLPFAVGVYLPVSTMTPIFLGGLLRWWAERSAARRGRGMERRERGILLGSGFVGGEGLLGVGIAGAAFVLGRRSTPLATEPPLRRLRVRVLARYPHDTEAFTQGLLLHGGELYESTGQYGRSSLRRVEVETGRVLAERPLPAEWFGEGLARVPGEGAGGDRLIQLTWQEGVAPVWRLDGLERLGEHHYTGEGWGLCHDPTVPGGRLVMSDGSARLTFRDPETFAETGAVAVTLEGRPVGLINELECVDGRVLANVLFSDNLLEIDPATGRVTALIQAAGLLTPAEARAADVLNGIAHDPADGTLLLTGKLWPWLFRVEVM
jgi:glutamine cyclotransferase